MHIICDAFPRQINDAALYVHAAVVTTGARKCVSVSDRPLK